MWKNCLPQLTRISCRFHIPINWLVCQLTNWTDWRINVYIVWCLCVCVCICACFFSLIGGVVCVFFFLVCLMYARCVCRCNNQNAKSFPCFVLFTSQQQQKAHPLYTTWWLKSPPKLTAPSTKIYIHKNNSRSKIATNKLTGSVN